MSAVFADYAPHTYKAWDQFGKKSTAYGRLLEGLDLFRRATGEQATHALLNPADAGELRASLTGLGITVEEHVLVPVGEVRLMCREESQQ